MSLFVCKNSKLGQKNCFINLTQNLATPTSDTLSLVPTILLQYLSEHMSDLQTKF